MPWAVAAAVVGGAISSKAQGKASQKAADSNREATEASATATRDRLDFDQQQYTEGAADRQFASDRARKTSDYQDQDRVKYNALQDEQVARGRVYQASEDKMLQSASNYDTTERRAEARGVATADVEQQLAAQRSSASRSMARSGVNPSSGKTLALMGQLEVAGAAAKAHAANRAGKDIETQGYARTMDAIGLGKGLVGNQATQAGLQLNAGNSSVNNSLVPLKVSAAAGDSMSAGYGNAALGFGATARLQATNFYDSNRYGAGVGASVGKALGHFGETYGDKIGSTVKGWLS